MRVFKLQRPMAGGGKEPKWLMYPKSRQPQFFVPPRFVPGHLRKAAAKTGKVYVEAEVRGTLVAWGDVVPAQDW